MRTKLPFYGTRATFFCNQLLQLVLRARKTVGAKCNNWLA